MKHKNYDKGVRMLRRQIRELYPEKLRVMVQQYVRTEYPDSQDMEETTMYFLYAYAENLHLTDNGEQVVVDFLVESGFVRDGGVFEFENPLYHSIPRRTL